MAKHKRKVKAFPPPSTDSKPKTALLATVTTRDLPVFCFRFADRKTVHPWRFQPSGEHAPALFEFICEAAQKTWGEIQSESGGATGKRHYLHHYQDIVRITDDAIEDIRKRNLGETFGDTLFRFRVSGEQRLWGFRDDRVFHVLWWDPYHKVYPLEPEKASRR
jgi:hypothetical protein